MKNLTAIRAAYEQARLDAALRGITTPPPSWRDIGELLAEIDNLNSELTIERERDDCGPQ